MRAPLAAALVLAVASCERALPPAPAGETPPVDPHVARRDAARLVLERHCGSCHVSAYDTALPGALAVYDLLEPEWAARATDLQLRDVVFRLGEPLGPDAEALHATDEERATVEAYVEAEIARRATGT